MNDKTSIRLVKGADEIKRLDKDCFRLDAENKKLQTRLDEATDIIQEYVKMDVPGMIRRLEDADKETLEQARLLGMSGEREAALLGKIERLNRLVAAQDEYINLITQEVSDLMPFAALEGWTTKRYKAGQELRERIKGFR